MAYTHSDTKICTKCGVEKGLGEFWVKRNSKDGRNPACKACVNEYHRAYREKNQEKTKEQSRAYKRRNADKVKEQARAYREKNPEKVKEFGRVWREANAEKDKERHRAYRERNAEKIKEFNRAYRERNAEKIKESGRDYYKRNLDKVKEAGRDWRERNPEKRKDIDRAYREAYPEKGRAAERRRRERKAAAPGYATDAQVAARCAMFGNKCWVCGAPAEAIDHVKPLAAGGSGWPCNLRPICGSCNSRKGAKWPIALFTDASVCTGGS